MAFFLASLSRLSGHILDSLSGLEYKPGSLDKPEKLRKVLHLLQQTMPRFIMRKALASVLVDAELQSDFRKSQIDFGHISGEEVPGDFTTLMKQPEEVRRQLTKYITFGGDSRALQ